MTQGRGGDSVVLVTGGASGVGRVIAESFIKESTSAHVFDASQERFENYFGANQHASVSLCEVGRPMHVVLLIVSAPILIVGVVMCVSRVRSLREDHP